MPVGKCPPPLAGPHPAPDYLHKGYTYGCQVPAWCCQHSHRGSQAKDLLTLTVEPPLPRREGRVGVVAPVWSHR